MSFSILRQRLIGAVICLTILALGVALLPAEIPLAAPLGTIARVLDSLAPQLLALTLALAFLAVLLGAWRSGVVLMAILAAGTVWFATGQLQRSLPLAQDEQPALRMLFFNVMVDNTANAGRIADAAIASGADIVAFSEGQPMRPLLPKLRAAFPYDVSCTGGNCGLLILSKLPAERRDDLGGGAFDYRLKPVTVQLGEGRELTLLVAHMLKPWFAGSVEEDYAELRAMLKKIYGPVVLVGDFNAAPWSRPLRQLSDATGLHSVRWPSATWPVPAGALGVPIDNFFVRGGARLTSEQAFGDDLGSNHRGVLADIAVTVDR